MANSTWNNIAGGSAILSALGSGAAAIGGATGSEFLSDLGPILAAVGGTGLAVAGAGAFATSDKEKQEQALAGQGLILAALAGQTTQAQATAAAQTAAQAAAISHVATPGVPTVTRTEAAAGGLAGAIAEIIALPFKILRKITG